MEKETQIALLKAGDRETIKTIYLDNQQGFRLFAKRYTIDIEEINNTYQDAVIALVENAAKGKLDELQSSISTYLFGIGKYLIFKSNKFSDRKVNLDAEEIESIPWETYEEESKDEEIKELKAQFEKLGTKCKELLRLFYYEAKSMDEIYLQLGYVSKDVLKSTKSRCLKSLKESMKK
ncbi:RNA polymerase sigma factor [Algoriphagus sp.]|uniref:RNA polymerase sigma factor n=1 Tax=Algoriphagus sp. TaxID=1872435 RepID=UPI00391A01C1